MPIDLYYVRVQLGMGDLHEGGWKNFVCVEPTSASKPVAVAPGKTWVGVHEATVLKADL